jgi:hypothetical protein
MEVRSMSSRRSIYGTEHDALWAAIRHLVYTTTLLGIAVIVIAVVLIAGPR